MAKTKLGEILVKRVKKGPLSVVNSARFILCFLLVNMVNPHDQIEPDTKFLLSSSESPDHMDDMDFTS